MGVGDLTPLRGWPTLDDPLDLEDNGQPKYLVFDFTKGLTDPNNAEGIDRIVSPVLQGEKVRLRIACKARPTG